jgi:hypothetical protein
VCAPLVVVRSLTRPIAQNFWKCRLLHGPVCFPMSCAGWGNQHHLRSKPRATEGNELACEHWRFNTGRRVGILYSFLSPCLCCLFFSTPWLQTKKKEQNEGRCTATCVSRCACAHLASRNSCRRLGSTLCRRSEKRLSPFAVTTFFGGTWWW